jgi:integron integrase
MQKRLLVDVVRDEIRLRHYSIRTEQAYIKWIIRYINFHEIKHPREMGAKHVRAFLSHLASNRNVTKATQNQALNALVFLYKHVLNMDLGDITGAKRANKPPRMPVVLTHDEISGILDCIPYPHKLIVRLLYGSGLRLIECLRMRVKDIDFNRLTVTVRGGKGDKDRITVLSKQICAPLKEHLKRVKKIHEQDLENGFGSAWLPPAQQRAMPNAAKEWIWQYVFPSSSLSIDPRSKLTQRHHIHTDSINKHIRAAAKMANIQKRVSSHSFRHSFATHMLESGVPIQTVQSLLGHSSIETTKIYLHVMRKPGAGLSSPEDLLQSNNL